MNLSAQIEVSGDVEQSARKPLIGALLRQPRDCVVFHQQRLYPKEPAMTHLSLRMISAAAAAVTTLVLFSSVVAIAEPQRSVLMAKSQHSDKAPVRVAMTLASNDVAKLAK